MIEDLITVSEAAQLKGVTRSVVYKAIERGDLKTQIILGRRALQRQDVLVWEPRKAGRHKGNPTSEEVKAKISQSQRLRWQKRKEQEK